MPTPEQNMMMVHKHAVHEAHRELPQLLDTVADDAVYEDVPRGLRYEGKKEVERFYLGLLGAFPDIKFELVNRRGGPEHVVEELEARATHLGPLDGFPATRKKVRFRLCIVFPIRPDGKIGGEVIYYDRLGLYQQLGALPQDLGQLR